MVDKKKPKGKSTGRQVRYESVVKPKLELITAWRRDGLLEVEVCKKLGVGVSTFNVYKKDHVELREAIKIGKADAAFKVENSLYKRANGYNFTETTEEPLYNEFGSPLLDDYGEPIIRVTKRVTKNIAADVGAIAFYLKNTKSEKWKDRQSIELSGTIKLEDLME